jgi:hypothetical protein
MSAPPIEFALPPGREAHEPPEAAAPAGTAWP